MKSYLGYKIIDQVLTDGQLKVQMHSDTGRKFKVKVIDPKTKLDLGSMVNLCVTKNDITYIERGEKVSRVFPFDQDGYIICQAISDTSKGLDGLFKFEYDIVLDHRDDHKKLIIWNNFKLGYSLLTFFKDTNSSRAQSYSADLTEVDIQYLSTVTNITTLNTNSTEYLNLIPMKTPSKFGSIITLVVRKINNIFNIK